MDPTFQNSGAGRALLDSVQKRYEHVRQIVLITDNEPGQRRAFYEDVGCTGGSDFCHEPLRVFARFRQS